MEDFCQNEEWLAAYLDKCLSEKERFLYELHLSNCTHCLNELIAARSELEEIHAGQKQSAAPADVAIPADAAAGRVPRLLSWISAAISPLRLPAAGGTATAAAVIAAVILGLGFFHLIRSPEWDPDFKAGRAALKVVLMENAVGDLRLSNGRDYPEENRPVMRGNALSSRRFFDSAERTLKKAADKFPRATRVYNLLGNLYLADDQLERAELFYRKAASINPSDDETINNLAVAAYRKGEIIKALHLLEEAARAGKVAPEIYYNLIIVHAELGDKGAADRYLERYLRVDRSSPWALKAARLLE
jgi:tetratricopeptide (TPR) repeat protein